MSLQFSGKELTAIIKLSASMMAADGRIDDNETSSLALEMIRFGVNQEQLANFIFVANNMQAIEAISIVSNLGDEGKKYVAAFLGYLMTVDGNVDDEEMKLWRFISTMCNLPSMNIAQAIKIIKEL